MLRAYINGLLDEGLTFRDIERETGIPNPTINKIYNGVSIPRIDTVEKLLGGFGDKLLIVKRQEV